MDKSFIGSQIMAIMLSLVGAYLIQDFWIIVGVFFMLWGNNMMIASKPRPRKVVKDWLGNAHLED